MSQPAEQKNEFQKFEDALVALANSYQEESKKLDDIDVKVRAQEKKALDVVRSMRHASVERKVKLEKEYNECEDELNALEQEYNKQLGVCYPMLKKLNMDNVQLATNLRNMLQNRITELEKQLAASKPAEVVEVPQEPEEQPPARVNRTRGSNLP